MAQPSEPHSSASSGSIPDMGPKKVVSASPSERYLIEAASKGVLNPMVETMAAPVEFDPSLESRVLLLYTGGTIGMKINEDGVYVPSPNYFERTLRTIPIFHDSTYPLRGSQSNPPLVLPASKDGKRVLYTFIEYAPLLDSCNMNMHEWAQIALDIKNYYANFEGFVILHGTDTMAYTASALSFMLENLGKPVIVTGSQVPIFETLSDGRDNLLGALFLAGNFCIPEVGLYFDNRLFRGCRTSKVSTSEFGAFDSPNMRPLVKFGTSVEIEWNAVQAGSGLQKFRVHHNLNNNVVVLSLFPSMSIEMIKAALAPPTAGVVLQSYGAGNIPSNRHEILEVFREARDRGLVFVNITQCRYGAVSAIYETGKVLEDAGVIAGSDMTLEAALTKLAYVLSKDSWDIPTKRKMMRKNLRGEMRAIRTQISSAGAGSGPKYAQTIPFVTALAKAMNLSSSEEIEMVKVAVYPSLVCAAAKEGNIEMLKSLVEYGDASINQGDYDNRTALHIACAEGNIDMVRYLLEQGAIVHQKDRFGQVPLLDSVHARRYDVIRLLVSGGAELNIPRARLAYELCAMGACNDIRGLRAYRLGGADLNAADYDGRTALHTAVCRGNLEAVQYLMKHGADPTLEDLMGGTPIQYAYLRKQPEASNAILAVLETREQEEQNPRGAMAKPDSVLFSAGNAEEE